jgi:hypothetical protein
LRRPKAARLCIISDQGVTLTPVTAGGACLPGYGQPRWRGSEHRLRHALEDFELELGAGVRAMANVDRDELRRHPYADEHSCMAFPRKVTR